MRDQNEQIPIRVIKKKVSHGGHSGGAWKVAYADFVTAMMALFIVLWIVSQSKQVKENVAGYFRDPVEYEAKVKENRKNRPMNEVQVQMEIHRREEEEKKKLESLGHSIIQNLSQDPSLAQLREQITIEPVKEGLRIELLDKSESFFFDIGTATLKPEAVKVLSIIAKEIGKLPNQIIIEGHTDSRQYSTVIGYTNFELSADRANSARRVLQTQGLRNGQIVEIRGYADTRLRNKNDPYDVSNRRISIIIKKVEGNEENGTETNDSRH
ncbi:MAG TPA: flagellar motor protein MotB [Bacteroidota bacterium]|nr:flagellar motor protein MotB [Bacteroidota bacterium]